MTNKPTYEDLEKRVRALEREVTKRNKVEEKLRQKEERYRLLFNSGYDAIFVHQPTPDGMPGKFIEVNDVACRIYGYTREELSHLTPLDLSAPEKGGSVHTHAKKVISEGHLTFETAQVAKDGREIPVEIHSHLFQLNGQPTVISIARDIAGRKQAEEALRKRTNELNDRIKELNCLFGISKLLEKPDIPLEEVLQGILHLLPPAWQYPEITCARATLKGQEFKTEKFEETVWELSDDIIAHGNRMGALEVFYLEKRPERDMGPFLNEERGLLHAICERLGKIIERTQMETALRESEAQKRAILDASIDRIRYVGKDMRIIWANKTVSMALNIPSEDLVGRACYEVLLGRDSPCDGCPTVRAKETGKIERAVIYHPKIRGTEGDSYWDNYSVPLKNEMGEILSFIQITRDITDQKRAEEHIHALTQQLMKVQESERQMISRELHDRVGQDLSTLKIGCDTLFDDQPEVPPEITQKVFEFSKRLERCIMAVRDLAYDLRPHSLDQLGLVQTIFQYCEDFSEKTGLSVDFTSAGMDDLNLDFDTEINLYRLVQEGLININKHADATHVTVRLVTSFPTIILRIEDDGKGFDVKDRLITAMNEKRMGLRSMEERVSLLAGKMKIRSRPGKGTKIFVEIPIKKKK